MPPSLRLSLSLQCHRRSAVLRINEVISSSSLKKDVESRTSFRERGRRYSQAPHRLETMQSPDGKRRRIPNELLAEAVAAAVVGPLRLRCSRVKTVGCGGFFRREFERRRRRPASSWSSGGESRWLQNLEVVFEWLAGNLTVYEESLPAEGEIGLRAAGKFRKAAI